MSYTTSRGHVPPLNTIVRASVADVGRTPVTSVALLGIIPEAVLQASSWLLGSMPGDLSSPSVHALIHRGGMAISSAIVATLQTGKALQLLNCPRRAWRPSVVTLARACLISMSLAIFSIVVPALQAFVSNGSAVKLWSGLIQISLVFYIGCRLLLWVPLMLERDLAVVQALKLSLASTRAKFWEIGRSLVAMGAPLAAISLLVVRHKTASLVIWSLVMPVAIFVYCRICLALCDPSSQ